MTFDYGSFTGRNLGFVDESEQQLLREASVFVCGVGGMGGAAFMALERAGKATVIDAYMSPLPSVIVVRPADPRPEERLGFPTLGKH